MKVFGVVNNADDERLLQEDLRRFDAYCVMNKLDINVEKCFLLTYTRRVNVFPSSYTLQDKIISKLTATKDLGVIHDQKLIFDLHIDSILNKASRSLGFIMRSSKPFRNMKTIKILYCAYVRSHLEYASQIWNPQYDLYIGRLERIQKKFVRYLGFKFKLPSMDYNKRCVKLHLLPLKLRRDINDVIFLVKTFRGQVDCPDLLNKLGLRIPTRRTRSRPLLSIPRSNSNYRHNTFVIRAAETYNRLCSNTGVDLFYSSYNSIKDHIINKFVSSL